MQQFVLDTPIIIIVEAKSDNIKSGFAQCISEMYAAYLYNNNKNTPVPNIYGVITTGSLWKFLKLTDKIVWIDQDEYHISNISVILGIFISFLSI